MEFGEGLTMDVGVAKVIVRVHAIITRLLGNYDVTTCMR